MAMMASKTIGIVRIVLFITRPSRVGCGDAAGSIWGYIGDDDEFSALVYYVIQHIPFENIVSYNISVCFGQSKVVITLPSLPHLLWIYAPG